MENEIKLSKDRAEQVLEVYSMLKTLTDYYRENNKDIDYIYDELCSNFNCYNFDGELFDIEYGGDVVFTYLDKFGMEDCVLVYNNEYEDWEQFSIEELINAYMGEKENKEK